jgi:glutaminyl-peptide cyclotransferase
MVAEHFKKLGGQVREQPLTATDPLTNAPVAMANLIGSWFPEREERVVLGAHYDSRPFPDEDPDPAKRKAPFIGANDPASGIAMLMEVAHHLQDSPTPWGVDLVLFDAEEIVYGSGQDQTGEYFLGSKHFARTYAKARREKKAGDRYEAAILFDLIAGKNLRLPRDPYSMEFAPSLVNDVWRVAQALKVPQFRSEYGPQVTDDHLPLNEGGIPAIDIIDFKYPHWHTSKDLPENCSGASLEAVGKVVTAWLNKPKVRGRR